MTSKNTVRFYNLSDSSYGDFHKIQYHVSLLALQSTVNKSLQHGDYLIPCLTLPEEEEQRFIGVWGQRHKRYLKEHKRAAYITLLTSGRLNSYLADIEEQAQERFERIVEQMKQAQGAGDYRIVKGR